MAHQWQVRPMRKRTDTTLWECAVCGLNAFGKTEPRQSACVPAEPVALVCESHCKHLGPKLGDVPCGCGAREKLMAVYACGVFAQCTERSTGKPQRFNGSKIACCLGCPQLEA